MNGLAGRRRLGLMASLVCAFLSAASSANEDYSGVYILLQETTTVAKVPVVADIVSTMRSVSVHRLSMKGERLVGRGKLCSLEIDSSSALVRTELPAALVRAMPAPEVDARIRSQGGEVTFTQPSRTIVLGAKLEDAERDELPTSKNDSRVYDQDGDGKPGVTVRVRGIVSGEVYVVQRSSSSLAGRRTPGGFSGSIRFSSQDVVLDASSGLLRRRTNTRPDLERSSFRLERAPDAITCSAAVARMRKAE